MNAKEYEGHVAERVKQMYAALMKFVEDRGFLIKGYFDSGEDSDKFSLVLHSNRIRPENERSKLGRSTINLDANTIDEIPGTVIDNIKCLDIDCCYICSTRCGIQYLRDNGYDIEED